MKKTMIFIILMLIVLSLSACGGSAKPEVAPTPSPTQSNEPKPTPEPTPESTQDPKQTLTISAITFLDVANIKSIDFADEKGSPVAMSSNWDEWFENAKVIEVNLTGSMHMKLNSAGGYDYSLMDGSKLRFVFLVDDKEYPIGVCEGAQFVVQESTSGYILLADESAELSPPPIDTSETSDAGTGDSTDNEPIDEWFKDVSWNGTSVQFTARKEAVVTGISIFVDGQEYPGDIITNSSGDMGLQNGTVAWAGSKLSLNLNPVIIFEGTSVSCEVDAGGSEPEQVCIYIESGEALMKNFLE